MSQFPAPISPPPLHIPASDKIVKVRLIDTTSRVDSLPAAIFYEPGTKGTDILRGPSYSFLVEHEASGSKLLFDLGVSKTWRDGPPAITDLIIKSGWEVSVTKSVSEILIEYNVPLSSIKTIIWSHWHWDHTGDPSLFPSTTSLTVGPGFKSSILPGYPANPNSVILESAYKDRELVEIPFDQAPEFRIGQFRAFDYFGDGSFYLLDTPGHTIGHICGLARTTPDTFVFMGGDICHHPGQLRPTRYLPLPEHISPNPFPSRSNLPVCPGSLLLDLHSKHTATEPFFTVANPPGGGISSDPEEAQRSVSKLEEADGHENIFTIIAHDRTVLDVLDFFPHNLNNWQVKGYKKQILWKFLSDFEPAVENAGTLRLSAL